MNSSTKTIVLLPGFMLDDALWDDFVPHLPRNWKVRRIALPRGRTVGEVARGMAEQLAEPVVLVGFSMGGYVARALAAEYPQLVEALALVATSARPERPAALLPPAGVFAGLSRRAIQSSLNHDHANDQALMDRVRAMSVRLGADAFVWQSALDRTAVPLSEITCPTLVVAASQDQLRSIDEARELASAIPGARLEIIEGAGHLIPLEAAASLADVLLDWLENGNDRNDIAPNLML